jgi:hypothetical protein
MAKTIALTIEIDGLSDITKQVVGLEQEIQKLNTELKGTSVGSDEYIKLRNEIATTTEQLKNAKKEQKDFIKSAEATKQAEGSYYALNQELVDLKKSYKNLSAAERDSAKGQELKAKIQGLDAELKKIDGSIGQFQRNVGNYPKGIGKIVKGLEQVIPGFENFTASLRNAEGGLNVFGKALIGGFLAFQGAKLIGQAMAQLDKFITKINETKETVATFSGAYGEDLNSLTAQTTALADTFSTDAKSISQAAQSLSQSLGIGFDEALTQLEGALVEGRGNADDYLKTIAEYPDAFEAASGEITDFSTRNKELLSTNKELAASQISVAERLQGVNDAFKNASNSISTGFLLVFAKIIDIFKPVGTAFYNLGVTISNLFATFQKGGEQTSLFSKLLESAAFPIQLVAGVLQLAADGISFLVAGIADFISKSPVLQFVFEQIGNAITLVYEGFKNLPAVFAGVIASLKQLGTNFVNFFQSLYLDAQIFAQQVKGVFGASVADAIADLRKQRDAVNKDGGTMGDAFIKGFNEAKAKGDAEALKQQKSNAAAVKKVDVTAINEARQRQQDAAKKLSEERKKYAEQEISDARARAALLADLQARLLDESIKNIQDAKDRELAETNAGFQKQIDDLNKNYEALNLAAKKREQELLEIFGKNSAELLAVQKANAEQLTKVAEEQAKIRTQIELQQKAAVEKINADSRAQELENAKKAAEDLRQFRDEALNSEISYIDSVANMRELANEETLNKKLMQETDAIKREEIIRLAGEQQIIDNIALIRNKLQAVDDQEAFLKSQADAGVEIKQEEYDAVLKARQELNTQLSSEELKQTQNLKTESDKQLAIRVKQFEEIAGYAQQGLQIIDEIGSAISARAEAQVQEQIDKSTERQEQLSADLEGATGLRRRFIQQQIDAEIAAQEKFAKVQEEIQIKAAKRQKAIAIAQATINGALAVTNILATTPKADFGIASAILIGLAVATTAAQIATIAAQPLAEGGAVVPVGLPDSGGKVVGVQNIPQTSKGDNVLVAARVGETFLNRKQTEKLRPILSAHKIPGFASGGLLGAPNLSGITQSVAIRAFNERTNAMQGQILESKVYLVTDELNRDTANQERIKKKVTFV